MVFFKPINLGIIYVIEPSGDKPAAVYAAENFAFSEEIIISPDKAKLNPPPAAVPFIATPIVVMISQYRSKFGDIFEKVTLTLYGLPHIAVGISMLFITIKIFPSIYQTFTTLIISYLKIFLLL